MMAIFRALDRFVSIGKLLPKDAGGPIVVMRVLEGGKSRLGRGEGRRGGQARYWTLEGGRFVSPEEARMPSNNCTRT